MVTDKDMERDFINAVIGNKQLELRHFYSIDQDGQCKNI